VPKVKEILKEVDRKKTHEALGKENEKKFANTAARPSKKRRDHTRQNQGKKKKKIPPPGKKDQVGI